MRWITQEGNPECTKKDFRQRIWVSQERPGLHKPIGVWIAVSMTRIFLHWCAELFFETVDGCEILHQLIADRCFFPIVCRVSTILLVLQDHFCCDGGASRLGGALFRRAIVNMTAAKISGTSKPRGAPRTMAGKDDGRRHWRLRWDFTKHATAAHPLFILERRPEGNRCARCVMPGLHGIFH
jgi:hypothetical protein